MFTRAKNVPSGRIAQVRNLISVRSRFDGTSNAAAAITPSNLCVTTTTSKRIRMLRPVVLQTLHVRRLHPWWPGREPLRTRLVWLAPALDPPCPTPVQRGSAIARQLAFARSEERRVGKECRSRWSRDD